MLIFKRNKKISLVLFTLFLVFSFFETSFAHTLSIPHTHCAGNPPYWVESGINCTNGPAIDTSDPNPNTGDPGVLVDPTILTPITTNSAVQDNTLLAPLPGLEDFESTQSCALGKYLNIMITVLIGIAAVLAMVMIVMGGIEYMTSELISSKEHGKEKIKNAVLGLLLALASWLILNTINPNLLQLCLDQIPKAEITIGPDAGDDTIDPQYAQGIKKYTTDASVSPGVTSAVTKLQNGWSISKFKVSTSGSMQIELKKGSQIDNSSSITIAPGKNGYAPAGTGQQGDGKTPLGNWSIKDVRYTPNVAQFDSKGSNMGAAFWHLTPMSSGERGIGMHGNKNGTLSVTNGCLRLKNSDILALQPYVHAGIPVIIQ